MDLQRLYIKFHSLFALFCICPLESLRFCKKGTGFIAKQIEKVLFWQITWKENYIQKCHIRRAFKRVCTTRPIKPVVKYQSGIQLARSIIGFGVCAVIYTPVLEQSYTAFSINMQNLLKQADL